MSSDHIIWCQIIEIMYENCEVGFFCRCYKTAWQQWSMYRDWQSRI